MRLSKHTLRVPHCSFPRSGTATRSIESSRQVRSRLERIDQKIIIVSPPFARPTILRARPTRMLTSVVCQPAVLFLPHSIELFHLGGHFFV